MLAVKRYPFSGISVLVVGGGVDEFLAALECWRKGHAVRVLKRQKEMAAAGRECGYSSVREP